MPTPDKLAYVDIETTGGSATRDRITEIAIVLVDNHEIVHRWSSLVNPYCPIPAHIQQLTGITNEMVHDAPDFASLVETLNELLTGRYFVAHNARFDFSFLKNAYDQIGLTFNHPVICTVKLSRKLYSQHRRHNLDTLIQRHNITCDTRHRALDDALVLPRVVASMIHQLGRDKVEQAMLEQSATLTLPPNLDNVMLEDLPNGPGVYLFYGENDTLLYAGKSKQIQTRVRSHLSGVFKSDRKMQMVQQIQRIETIETAGEIGALLLEANIIKSRQPLFNQRLRRNGRLYGIHWHPESSPVPAPVSIDQLEPTALENTYGLFRSQKQLQETLRKLATDHQLCLKQLGLEKGKGPCFAYQLHKCRGACVNEEPIQQHNMRLQTALQPIRIHSWPHKGAVGIRETHPDSMRQEIHVINHWQYLGSASDEHELTGVLESRSPWKLDIDIYRILEKSLRSSRDIVQLDHHN